MNGWRFIESQNASNDANLDFTNFDSNQYDAYVFVYMNVIPSTDNAAFMMRFSSDGGSSYDSSSIYNRANIGYNDGTIATSGTTDRAPVGQGTGSDTNESGNSGIAYLFAPHNTTYTHMMSQYAGHNDTGNPMTTLTFCSHESAAVVDAVQFSYSSGNIESGTISMYGVSNSDLLATIDLSNNATVEFTEFDSSAYDSYVFMLMNVVPSTDNTLLRMRTSSDGGSTYDSGASDYIHSLRWYDAGDSNEVSTTADTMRLSKQMGSDTNEYGLSGLIEIHAPHLAQYTQVISTVGGTADSGAPNVVMGHTYRQSSADVNAVQFFYQTGNLESGTINMYGIPNA